MHSSQSTILAVATQKGGTGKSTTAVNLAHAFALSGKKILVVDMDPQGNASNSLGFKTKDQGISIADLIWDKSVPVQSAINKRTGMDVIIANTNLARVERGMLTMVNSELRLAQRLREVRDAYDYIIIDSTPSYGPLLNSVLNVADQLVVPVDSNYFALMGIQKLLGEVEEIRITNPAINVLGYLMTMVDRTIICSQTTEAVIQNFGAATFDTKIRRSVAFREAPTLGQTVFEYAPGSAAAGDYSKLSVEIEGRIRALRAQAPSTIGGAL